QEGESRKLISTSRVEEPKPFALAAQESSRVTTLFLQLVDKFTSREADNQRAFYGFKVVYRLPALNVFRRNNEEKSRHGQYEQKTEFSGNLEIGKHGGFLLKTVVLLNLRVMRLRSMASI
ncbi:hypothetical protein LI168_06375, partial [Desulfovibrio desulfuricans]|uniref:hypothetical protein n=1 Tax=Desulfovibrio desulfuricans TaxID=876 RepID=UPI001D0650AC